MSNQSTEVEVLKPAKFAFNANLKGGDDAATAKQLNKLFAEAQNGMRRVIALGLFAWQVKERQLKHGEFGAWLAQHCPKLATVDSVTGKAKTSRALSGYMELTKNVLEGVGFPTIEKYLDEAEKFSGQKNLNHGGFLLIADKKVPDSVKPLREKICQLVDGKTQRQLFLEFKQADDEDNKPKRGRLKGSTGLTKEMRERAAAREEEQRINELEETILERNDWLLEVADAKNLGMMDSKLLKKFINAADTASGFAKRTLASRATDGGAK
ncbi:MAG: hypothetical protein WCH99_04955 [Verrucomicrobiota bacterium]